MDSDDPTPDPGFFVTDLFIGLAGVLLIALAGMSPSLRGLVDAGQPHPVLQDGGQGLALALPDRLKLITPDGKGIDVALGELPHHPALTAWAEAVTRPVIVVDQGGGEVAFLFEGALARLLPGVTLARVRLPPGCTRPVITPTDASCG